jgi:hypothetical protein
MNRSTEPESPKSSKPTKTKRHHKKGPERCQYRTPTGRQCMSSVLSSQSSFCPRHAAYHATDHSDFSAPLLHNACHFLNAQGINYSLAQLYELLATGRISPRRAAVLAHITSLLMRSLHAIDTDRSPNAGKPSPEPRPEPTITTTPNPDDTVNLTISVPPFPPPIIPRSTPEIAPKPYLIELLNVPAELLSPDDQDQDANVHADADSAADSAAADRDSGPAKKRKSAAGKVTNSKSGKKRCKPSARRGNARRTPRKKHIRSYADATLSTVELPREVDLIEGAQRLSDLPLSTETPNFLPADPYFAASASGAGVGAGERPVIHGMVGLHDQPVHGDMQVGEADHELLRGSGDGLASYRGSRVINLQRTVGREELHDTLGHVTVPSQSVAFSEIAQHCGIDRHGGLGRGV